MKRQSTPFAERFARHLTPRRTVASHGTSRSFVFTRLSRPRRRGFPAVAPARPRAPSSPRPRPPPPRLRHRPGHRPRAIHRPSRARGDIVDVLRRVHPRADLLHLSLKRATLRQRAFQRRRVARRPANDGRDEIAHELQRRRRERRARFRDPHLLRAEIFVHEEHVVLVHRRARTVVALAFAVLAAGANLGEFDGDVLDERGAGEELVGDGGASVLGEFFNVPARLPHLADRGFEPVARDGGLGGDDDEVAAGLRHLGHRAPDDLVEGGALGAERAAGDGQEREDG